MDYKDFKKTASDKNSTTLTHPNGHVVKVVHGALSAKERAALAKLPMSGTKMMAKGGDPTDDTDDSSDETPDTSKQGPVQIFVGGQGQQGAMPMPAEYQPGVSPPGPVATTGTNPANPGPQDNRKQIPAPEAENDEKTLQQELDARGDGSVPANPPGEVGAKVSANQDNAQMPQPTSVAQQAPTGTPTAAGVPTPAPEELPAPTDAAAAVAPTPAQQTTSDLLHEDMAWQHDLANQHVTAENYGSLFAKRDTVGKIGLLFGLLLGGAGSGITGQPNAVIQMMDNEIKNDLAAQTSSKTNAQNFFKLNYEHQLQLAQGQQLGASARHQDAEAKTKAYALSNMQANRSAVQDLMDTVNKYPPGSPQRLKAEQTLAMVSNSVNNENYSIAQQAGAKIQFLRQMGINMAGEPTNAAQPGQQQSQNNTTAQLRKMSTLGYIDKGQYDKANEEVKMVQNKQQANAGALDSFDKVSKMVTAGNRMMNPIQSGKQIAAEWDPMLDKLTKSNEGRVTPITVEMMNGIKPAIGDSDETKNIKRQKLNEILNSGYSTPVLDGLNMQPNKTTPKQSAPTGEIRYDAQGNAWKMGPNGKPVRVK
jgi:hypothetical protein